jgi:cation diffusion facilitator family transporter
MDPANVAAVRRVLWIELLLNVAVAVAKLVVGIATGSLAVQSDGIHSSVDGLNNVVALVALRYAAEPPDREHPYGHGKIETLTAFVVAGLIVMTAFELSRIAVGRLFGAPAEIPQAGFLVPAVMLATLAINLGISSYEQRRGRELGSALLLADAAHTRSDALVTSAVLVSWVLTTLGYPAADAVVSLLIMGFILRIGYAVFTRTVPILIDAVRIPPEEIRRSILRAPGVITCDQLRTRGEGHDAFVECRIRVEQAHDAARAHALTEEIERRLRAQFGIPPENITIHVEL